MIACPREADEIAGADEMDGVQLAYGGGGADGSKVAGSSALIILFAAASKF